MTSGLIMALGPTLIKKQSSLFIIPDELSDDNALLPADVFSHTHSTN